MKKIATIIGGIFLLSASITPVLASFNEFVPQQSSERFQDAKIQKIGACFETYVPSLAARGERFFEKKC